MKKRSSRFSLKLDEEGPSASSYHNSSQRAYYNHKNVRPPPHDEGLVLVNAVSEFQTCEAFVNKKTDLWNVFCQKNLQ